MVAELIGQPVSKALARRSTRWAPVPARPGTKSPVSGRTAARTWRTAVDGAGIRYPA